MIPGNTPEDVEWEKMLDAIECEASDLIMRAEGVLLKSQYFRYDDDTLQDLVCDALGVERG